jgi:hypothetical protein
MRIERTIAYGHINDKVVHATYTKRMTGAERISLLEELRYDLGRFLGRDYSGRFKRVLSVVKQKKG